MTFRPVYGLSNQKLSDDLKYLVWVDNELRRRILTKEFLARDAFFLWIELNYERLVDQGFICFEEEKFGPLWFIHNYHICYFYKPYNPLNYC